MIGNRFTVATPEEKEVPSPSNRFTINKIPETTSNVVPKESTFARRVAAKYNVPETTIGKVKPQAQPQPEKEEGLLSKAGKYVLQTNPFIPGNLFDRAKTQVLQPVVDKTLNIPVVQDAMKAVAERTSGTGVVSMIQSAGPEKTFKEAYDANREAQAGNTSKLDQFMTQLGDSVPQTAIGVALNFVPYAGKPLSTAYWTALSANEQIESKGKVESLNPILIDVVGDRMLGNSIEAMFKTPSKTLLQTVSRSFVTEGGTEVAQDLLKYQDAYLRAKTSEERAEILAEAKQYFTSGQILMTLGVGGISGAGVGTAAYTLNQSKELYEGMTPEERQAGFAKVPGVPEETQQQEAKKFDSADEFIKKVDDERITFKTKDGKFSVTVTESTPEYELVDDITQSQLEKLGLDSDDFITKIEHIEVDKSLQGKGLGTKLMNRAIKETIENGHDFVYLNASLMGNKGLSLDGLTKFYEEFGFKIIKKQGNNNLMGATKSQLKDIYNKAKGVSLKSEEIVKKSPQQLSQEIKTGLKSTSDVVRDVSLKKTIPQQEKLHKSLTENGRVLVDDKGKQVFPKPIKENPTPLENPIIKEAKAGLKEEKELKKVQDALEGVNKKHGQTEIIIESLKKKGVSQEQINNIVLENGDRLVDTVKVKREKNGVLSATIRKDTLQEMEKDFTLDLADKKWIPTKTAMQKVKEGVKSGKETPLIYYELPQIFHDRTGLRDYFYDPVREGERNADKMKTAIYNEFEKAGLLNRGSWVTAERFALSKKEAEKIGRYYLTRQGKGGKTELSNLTPKEQKFVKTFDNVIKESEERFYKVAELNGKSPGKVENYAPIMSNQDYKLAQEVGDMDFIFRKHPAFFSLKQRQEKVPFDMYELDYRKVASRWIDQMANFNHLGEVGVQTKYLANSSEFKDIVGDKVFNTTNKWLKDTFNPQVLSPAEKGGKIVRQATSIASLGLNMASVVKQYLSIIPLTIIEKAPPKLTSKFAKDFGIKVSELPSIRERKGNVSIMDMQNGLRKAFVGPLTGADKQVAQLELNSLLDRNYKRLLKEGNSKDLSPEMQAQLIKQAQDTLDIWMGGMTRAQLPLAFRTELGKLLNMFIYPLTSQLNGFIYSVAKAKGFSKAEKFAEVMASMLAIAYMEQVITNLSPQWSDKKEMVWDTLSSLAGNIPLLSQAVFAIRTDQPITPSPILGSISRVFSQTSKYFDDNANAGDVAFAWGELFGMPKGIRRATEGVELIREDGVRDKNGKLLAPVKGTWEQIRGFLRGKYGTIATQDWIRNIGVKTADRQWFVPEVEFLQNGNYDRKEELYKLFDKETQDELYAELSEGQQKKLDKALRTPPKTLEHKKRLFREKIKKALEEGTMTTKEAIEKTNQFKQAIERLQ